MNAEKEREGGARPNGSLRIEGEMTIYQAAELKQALLAALEQDEEVEIDLSAVSEIDTAGVQLLIAAGKTAQAKQKRLRLAEPSAAVTDVFKLFDLDGWIDGGTSSQAR
jgi:anti-anti-sigma factor